MPSLCQSSDILHLAILQDVHAMSALVLAAVCRAFRISKLVGATARTADDCAGREVIPSIPANERGSPSGRIFGLALSLTSCCVRMSFLDIL